MRYLKKMLIFASLMLWGLFPTSASSIGISGSSDWPTVVTIHESFRIGNLVLSPGEYYFKLTSGTVSRNAVMIFSIDRWRWEGMVMGIQANREDVKPSEEFVFGMKNTGEPPYLEYWFYPNWNRGIKFVYSSGSEGSVSQMTDVGQILTAHNLK